MSTRPKNGVNNFWVFKNPSHENSKCRKSPCRNSAEMCMCRKVPGPKHARVEMCTCRKVPVPKRAGAEKSPCRKNPVPKRARVGISQMPKHFCAEMFRCRKVPVPKSPRAEKAPCRNVPVLKCPSAETSAAPNGARAGMLPWWNICAEMTLAEMSRAEKVYRRWKPLISTKKKSQFLIKFCQSCMALKDICMLLLKIWWSQYLDQFEGYMATTHKNVW